MTKVLSVKNLNFSIQNHSILENLSFEVPENSFFSIVGPNGAGKSMLVRLILGLLKPSSGELNVLETSAANSGPEHIGYVPQIKSFDRSFPALGKELVASGLHRAWPTKISEDDKNKIQSALAKLNASSLYDRQIKELSGGELQRLYLARAIAQSRKILILDEPSTGIDSLGEIDLYEIVEKIRRETKVSVVMVTHDIEVARHHSSHCLILNQKQIAFGTPTECLTHENLSVAFGHGEHSHA